MKKKITYKTLISINLFCFILVMISSCDSKYTPRTVQDRTPPSISVRLNGAELNRTYTIMGMSISPIPPESPPKLIPGKTYKALIAANDTIGLYNLRVGLNKDYFEISEITAAPANATTSEMGGFTIIDVTLPISPAKTGALISFTFKAKPMSANNENPFLGFNVFATDFGEAGRSSNVSGYTIPIAYFPE